jgi:hypothetical protein
LVRKPTHHVPTPTASDHIERKSTSSEALNYETNKTVSLDRWAKMYPTPSASGMPCEGTVRLARQRWLDGDCTLEEANAIAGRDVRDKQGKVPAMWPTPDASMGTGGRVSAKPPPGRRPSGSKQSITLNDAVKWWPTPTSRDWKDGTSIGSAPVNCLLGRAVEPSPTGGALNPTWVEWLMGFPLGWTVCDASATRSSRRSSKSSGEQ